MPSYPRSSLSRFLIFAFSAVVLIGGGIATALTLPAPAPAYADSLPRDLEQSFGALNSAIARLNDAQARSGRQVVSTQDIERALLRIQLGAEARQYDDIRGQIRDLEMKIALWDALAAEPSNHSDALVSPLQKPVIAAPNVTYHTQQPLNLMNIPILLYHYPPLNFAAQLTHLKNRGYQAVDLDQVSEAIAGRVPLPQKPVVITFDDGFSAQMSAFEDLKRFNMKATFYIISSGEGSRWCIGAGRRYGDSLQPPGGCGDAYFNWDQVRILDRSGLITIGAHTVDHENLAADSAERQRYEISESKAVIEREIGHPVRHFCYPYGAYTALTSRLVAEAGFVTATTTLPGTLQPEGSAYQLRRIRDALVLP